MKEYEIVQACDRHSNETATLRKHVTKYEHVLRLAAEVFTKYESRDIKIDSIKLIRNTKVSISCNFLNAVPLCDVIKRTRFLMWSPVNRRTPWSQPTLSFQKVQRSQQTAETLFDVWKRRRAQQLRRLMSGNIPLEIYISYKTFPFSFIKYTKWIPAIS